MEEYTQITLGQWMSWKEDIRTKLAETTENFVHIGYRLKQIRDSGMYDGAADIFEFAQKEYGLGKSTVSRFIAINEKYSEGGNSLELKAEFKGFSSSKLAEMLTLPDEEMSMITEKTTIKEIRELKNFDKQDADGEDGGQEGQLTALQKCIIEYFRDKKEILNRVLDAVYDDDMKTAAGLVNPGGYGTYNKGLIYIFFYGYEEGIKYRQFGQDGVMQMSWNDFLLEVYDIFSMAYEEGKEDVHGAYYGRQEPVATSQQEGAEKPEKTIDGTSSGQEGEDEREQETVEEEDREDPDEDNKPSATDESCDEADGTGAGTGEGDIEDREDSEDNAGEQHDAQGKQEEQLEGQMDTTDFPEYMPDGGKTKDPAEQTGADSNIIDSRENIKEYIIEQSYIIRQELGIMDMKCVTEDWDEVINEAKDIIIRAENIKKMMEAYGQ